MTAVDQTITLKCGEDYWAQFAYTDPSGNPIAITSPKMEIRVDAVSTATVLYTSEGGSPTIILTQPSANEAFFRIPSANTKNQTVVQTGYWDAFATDPDGYEVCLGSGIFASVLNVTVL